jgi:glycosyltransferase involved in cell wall biosynthesis
MRIVYLAASVIPSRTANSIHVMKMCEAFSSNGHEVLLLAARRRESFEKRVNNIFEYYGVEGNFNVRKKWFPDVRGGGIVHGLLCKKDISRFAPDIVYGRQLYSITVIAFLGYRVIYEMHQPRTRSNLAFKYLVNLDNLEHLVVISNALCNIIQGEAGSKDIIVAHDGANCQLPKKQPEAEINYFSGYDDSLKIGYVGHLYPGKGGELIVNLAKEVPGIVFHVFGGFQEDIDRLSSISPENVAYHGFVPHNEVPAILSTLDVLLLPPSRVVTPYSGKGDIGSYMSPLKMFEYMAVGKPIIASDLPVLREVLKHKYNALLVPPNDVKQWKSSLLQLMGNPLLRNKLGKQAREDLENKYTWVIRAKRVIANI